MKVISANLNGIRSAGRKGFFDWLKQVDADVICMQETKAQMAELTDELYRPEGYHCYFCDAQKKGYSGVGIYTKQKPNKVICELGIDIADTEGRFIQVDFPNVSVISLYLPSGTTEERQTLKFRFMDEYLPILKDMQTHDRDYIICGDWNIVHKRIDIKNFTSNQKSSGCLPEEREWIDNLFTQDHYVDAFRVLNQEPDQYTWWSFRGRAYEKNVGWRIDYQIVTPGLKDKIKQVDIYKDQKFSDHAPLIIDYDIASF